MKVVYVSMTILKELEVPDETTLNEAYEMAKQIAAEEGYADLVNDYEVEIM